MKKLKKLMITVAALMPLIVTTASPAKAYTFGSITPNYGGGYSFYEYGPGGYTSGYISPNYGGGYNWSIF